MAKKKTGAVLKLGLVCAVCKTRGYITSRNKINTPEKLKLKKFCRKCRKVTEHKEVEKLK
ncbi:MAG: 50S ribosomal protein L33 [Candidatus Levyibacteriota bacterium]